MRIFKKIKGTDSQHTIEYAILLTLIMAGIIISGPYVIRSWNANLKGWEDSVQDSLQDPLVGTTPPPISGCDPQSWVDQGCNIGIFDPCTGLTFSCEPLEMLSRLPFDPAGCQCDPANGYSTSDYLQCTIDDRCCIYEPGACGVLGGCPDGQRYYTETCGSNAPGDACGYLPPGSNIFIPGGIDPLCVFNCTQDPPTLGSPPFYNGMCTDDNIGLPGDVMISFVVHGACTDPTKCEWQCGAGYYPVGVGAGAYCSTCAVPGIERTGCAGTRVDPRGCPIWQFVPCCYSIL